MPICPTCHRMCKTAQGLSGHMRFRHQMTVPKQDLSIYARDRLDKAEDENTKLREQVARHQRQLQDQETLNEKRMAEQKTQLERARESKPAEQQRAAVLKQHEEQVRSERARAHEEAIAALREQIRSERARAHEKVIAALQKQLQDLQREIEQSASQKKKTQELGKSPPEIKGQGTNTGKVGDSISESEKARQDLRRERDRARGSSLLPPLPHPLHPASSLREIGDWLFGQDE